ncbi:DMT family transporter [Tropicimonas sp. IMCC6043]|uniref:DMT family transporter n=1 Tax=Tropicimonas sp. IMCC6043 TaxID=2510645 RepID=UPI00101BD310|nr:DMT family transporter [Tropicimonas sp. IMCC6043]RYH07408.1 DMT family transporter [Tropicimonas sp. IMCC6043]
MTRIFARMGPAAAGAFFMIAAGALFAAANAIVQYGAMVHGIAPARLAFWQYLVALLVSLPWLYAQGLGGLRSRAPHWHLLRVALAAAGVQLWVAGLAHVPIWQAIALILLSPIFVTLGAVTVLGERASLRRWIALGVGVTGGMIILAPWSDAFTWHALLPVGAAALWAAHSLVTKRLTQSESPESLTVYLLLLLTPFNAAAAWGVGFGLDFGASGLLLLAAGLVTALAQYAVARAYSHADAAYLQPFDTLKLLFNVALGAVIFGFVPPGSLWLGAALIIGASSWLLGAGDAPDDEPEVVPATVPVPVLSDAADRPGRRPECRGGL